MRRLWKTLEPLSGDLSVVHHARDSRVAPTESAYAAPNQSSSTAASPLGFPPRSRPAQLEAEAHALAVPTPENARSWLRILTAEPHVAGTPADYKTAVFVRDKLREWGWKAEIRGAGGSAQLSPSSGIRRCSRSSGPIAKKLSLDEAPIATDKDSASSAAFGAFNGYGVSGEASGQVVYVNYGRPEDYAALEKMGIDVKGKIVLVRYGSSSAG